MARTRTALMATMGLALMLAPSTALAKKGKNGKKGKKGRGEITMTGFKSFDKVFKEVADIDARVSVAETALKTAKRDLNTALDLKRGTPLKDALADLKVKGADNLQVVMKGKVPQLTVSELAPSNITNAAEAVNGLTSALVTSIDELAGVPEEIAALTKQAQKFPERAKKEFTGDPIGALFKAPKLVKSLNGNLKVTTALPKRSTKVTGRATEILSVVSTEFVPAGIGGGAGNTANNPRTRGSGGNDSDARTGGRTGQRTGGR